MKNFIVYMILVCSLVAIGIAIGYKRYFPVPLLVEIRNELFTPQDNLTIGRLNQSELNTPHEMPVVSSGYQYLYSELPVSYKIDSTSCPKFTHFLLDNRNYYCNELKYLESGIRTFSILLKAKTENSNKLVIYNHGHGGLPVLTEKFAINFIDSALKDGYDVLLVSMPFLGLNKKQGEIYIKTTDGVVQLQAGTSLSHSIFEGFSFTSSNYLRFFIDDATFFINESKKRYSNINYVGHSGGAWTGAHVCSMFSGIINKCFLSSGVMTYDIRIASSAGDIGDAEQISNTINKIHPISKELKMASKNTKITLYYNTNDVCCFNGSQPSKLRDKLQKIAPNVDIIIDDNNSHSFDAVKALHFIKN